ncbi:MAG: hypothetical protein PHC51_13855 [bacterium]|nr:hypothetical protein [bacterium]
MDTASTSPIFSQAQKITDAIICLRDAGHHVAAVMLTYAAIDQMSWLSIPGNLSCGKDFKAWVKKYILTHGNLDCSEDDLWAARNGMLHMGTAESKNHTDGNAKNKIYYTVGKAACTSNSSKDVVFLNVETLIAAYLAGVLFFMEDLRSDRDQLSNALAKIGKTLTVHGL